MAAAVVVVVVVVAASSISHIAALSRGFEHARMQGRMLESTDMNFVDCTCVRVEDEEERGEGSRGKAGFVVGDRRGRQVEPWGNKCRECMLQPTFLANAHLCQSQTQLLRAEAVGSIRAHIHLRKNASS